MKIDRLQDYVPELVVGFIGMHRISANRIWKQSTAVTCGYITLVVKEVNKVGNSLPFRQQLLKCKDLFKVFFRFH